MTRNFILNEGQGPSVISYIQSIGETLNNMTPKTASDQRRLEIAKENLLNIRRWSKRMEEKMNFLEEEMRIIREEKKIQEDYESSTRSKEHDQMKRLIGMGGNKTVSYSEKPKLNRRVTNPKTSED